jgi:hypothetical protein
MNKRPPIDLASLTAEHASPMPEAVQRTPKPPASEKPLPPSITAQLAVNDDQFETLNFKVPLEFRKRFKRRAVEANLKLYELLFEALDAWEQQKGHKE